MPGPRSPLWAVILASAWFAAVAAIKVHALHSYFLSDDLAYYGNMLYNTGFGPHGHAVDFLYSDRGLLSFESRTFMVEHFSPTFALLAPLYRLYPHPLTLVILQPLLIALAGLGIFRLAYLVQEKSHAPALFSLLPVLFLAAYLGNSSTLSATIDSFQGFHHDSLIPPLLVWTLVFVMESRWRLTLVFFALLLGTKENIPIIASLACAACFVSDGLVPRRKAAIGLVLCAVFFAGCLYFEFRTHNRHVGIIYRFADFDRIYEALDRIPRWSLLRFFWPGLLVPALALPALAEWWLQLMGDTTELDWHSFPLVALAVTALVFACFRALAFARTSRPAAISLQALLAVFIFIPMLAGGWRSFRSIQATADRLPVLVDSRSLEAIRASIPADARVSTTSDLQVFFTDRRHLLWPASSAFSDHILVNNRSGDADAARVAAFQGGLPRGDYAGRRYQDEMSAVARGFEYDTNLRAYAIMLVNLHLASMVRTEGDLILYKITPQAAYPD